MRILIALGCLLTLAGAVDINKDEVNPEIFRESVEANGTNSIVHKTVDADDANVIDNNVSQTQTNDEDAPTAINEANSGRDRYTNAYRGKPISPDVLRAPAYSRKPISFYAVRQPAYRSKPSMSSDAFRAPPAPAYYRSKPFSSDAFRAPAQAYRGKPASSDALRAPAPAYRRKPISSDALRAPSYRKLVWSNAPELPAYFVSEDPITATDFSGSDEIRIYDNSNDFDSWPSVVRAYHPIPKDDSYTRVYAIYNANGEDFDDNRRGEYQTGYDRGGYYGPYGF